MADRSTFDRLSETLSEKERKDLLEKITRSMNFQQSADEGIYHKQMTSEERERLVQGDLARVSLFGRLFLWLQALFSGKSKKDLLIGSKIHSLKATINRKYPGLTGFETRDLSAKLAEEFFRLYSLTLPVKAIYRKLLFKTREVEGAFIDLFEDQIPEALVGLTDILPIDALQEIYESKGAEAGVKREILRRLDEYAGKIDDTLFESIEEQVVPIFYLKDIVFFPFASFFQLFHLEQEGLDSASKPRFKSASAMLAIEYLEKMYFAIYAALKIPEPYTLSRPVVHYLAGLTDESAAAETKSAHGGSDAESGEEEGFDLEAPETLEQAPPGETEELEEPESESEVSSDLEALYKEVRRFDRAIPIAELIRYFLRDPYYRLYVYVPKLRLKEYYTSVLKMRCIAEFMDLIGTLRVRALERQIERLFTGQKLLIFQNYREYKSLDYDKLGIPIFTRTRALNVLYNFIRLYYREQIQEMIKILSNIVLVQNRLTRNKLLLHATALEDLEQKIKEFDEALNPDAEEGKVFHKLRVSLAGDTGHQRAFRTMVFQKDGQAAAIVERGRENLVGLQKVFFEITGDQSDAIRERLETKYYLNGKLLTLSQFLEDRSDRLGSFLSLLLQLIKSEGG